MPMYAVGVTLVGQPQHITYESTTSNKPSQGNISQHLQINVGFAVLKNCSKQIVTFKKSE
jgi:hypothetical protein